MDSKTEIGYIGARRPVMSAKIEVKDGNFQITIPVKEAYRSKPVRELLEILRAQEVLSRSQATEEQIRELAEELTSDWWEANREWVQRESGD